MINNEGQLSFEYDLEDYDSASYDTEDKSTVFNCGDSALWVNFYKVFKNDVNTMYNNLRSGTKFNYNYINNKMQKHQSEWPEAIWNEDEYNKYIGSFLDKGKNYLDMLQGDKKAQRDWWLFNGFKYRDSKYYTADATSNFITLRCYASGGITVTPYQHLHPRIKYGSTVAVSLKDSGRVKRNTPVLLENPLGNVEINDLETYIYSADRIASVGDLSHLKVGLADFAMATKLQEIVLGSEAEGYQNSNLKSLTVGNNELLTLVNVSNCNSEEFTNLDLSGCHGIETILAEGTKLTGVALPNGGHLTTLKLPETIANLTIQNQKNIKTLSLQGQNNLTTLRIEGTPGLPIESLINNSPILNRVRLTNIEWNATNEETLRITINKLMAAKGLDANGLNLEKAVVTGRVHIKEISDSFLEEINDRFPELVIVVNGVAKYFIRYADWDNTLLYRYIATEGTAAIDPIEAGYIETPIRPDTETAKYTYKGWSETPETIHRPYSIIAKYLGEYLVTFYDDEDNVLSQEWVIEGNSATDPVASGQVSAPKRKETEKYTYSYAGWDLDFTNIDGTNLKFYPRFNEELRSFWIYFYNDEIKLQESKIFYGDVPIYTGSDDIQKMIGGEPSPYYEFSGWSPDPTQPITKSMTYYAQFAFNGYVEESWEQIVEDCRTGNISKYGLGGRKRLTYTIAGKESTIEMEIVGKNHDQLAQTSADYNNGAETASISFMAIVMGSELWNMNSSIYNDWDGIVDGQPKPEGAAGYNYGGWGESQMRKRLQEEFFGALPAVLQNNIKSVVKLSDRGDYYPGVINRTEDKLWIPSTAELNIEVYNTVPSMGQGKPYPLYNIDSSRIKARGSNNAEYWTRSSTKNDSHQWRYIDSRGVLGSNGGSSSKPVAIGFCL